MTWTLRIENVAGIRRGEATLRPGLNAVRGTNWQGKTSFVEAVETALGTAATLTEGQDRGRIVLETDETTHEVELVRTDEGVTSHGDPLLTDEYDVVRAELYACLDERNAVRRTVRDGGNLEEVLTRPLDFENIEERIAALRAERERVDSELAQAREAKKRLPSVQERITRLEGEIADARERLAAVADGDGGADRDERQERLSQTRAERDRVASRVDRLEASLERVEDELAEKRAALEDLSVPAADDAGDLEATREQLQAARRDVEVLQSLYSANQLVLEEDRVDLVASVERDLLGDELECWVCGAEADRATVEQHLAVIGDRISRLRGDVERHRDELDRIEARRERREQVRRRERDLEDRIAELTEQREDRERSLAEARERRSELEAEIEELSASVEEAVAEITDVESEIKYRETELEEARDERETLERRAERADELAEERSALADDVADLRDRKDEIKRRTRETFDAAVREVVDRFDTGFETARLTPDFDLVVARGGRQASPEALSEGELELLGLVAALAGFEAFDVGERVPVLLVDGVASLADENLHALVSYLDGRTEYLVFTAHPENDPFDGHEIDPGAWTVVSDDA